MQAGKNESIEQVIVWLEQHVEVEQDGIHRAGLDAREAAGALQILLFVRERARPHPVSVVPVAAAARRDTHCNGASFASSRGNCQRGSPITCTRCSDPMHILQDTQKSELGQYYIASTKLTDPVRHASEGWNSA